jgi:hypothetical protein
MGLALGSALFYERSIKMNIDKERFEREIQRHQMTVLKNDGLYRHIYVGVPGTSMESFNILTSPEHLFYYGDMGDFVFHRYGSEDMLKFFNTEDLQINTSYWSEKCVAGEKEEWSIEAFRNAVRHDTEEWDFSNPEEHYYSLREQVDDLISSEDEWEAVTNLRDWSNSKHPLNDFWEHNMKEYTPRFLWCLYALSWTANKFFSLDTI